MLHQGDKLQATSRNNKGWKQLRLCIEVIRKFRTFSNTTSEKSIKGVKVVSNKKCAITRMKNSGTKTVDVQKAVINTMKSNNIESVGNNPLNLSVQKIKNKKVKLLFY